MVGGGLRDAVSGRLAAAHDPAVHIDWDLTTSALPEQTQALFPSAVYENAFGTVTVRTGGEDYEITTFRSDHDYADFRRPHRVEFGTSIEADLARRDFTMNALAWGAAPPVASDDSASPPGLLDPYDGLADIRAGVIRAVGEPTRRFAEDALRIVRAIRFAAVLGWTVEPATLAAIHATAPLVAHLSGERVAMELAKLLAAGQPSIGLRLLEQTGVLAEIAPELVRQRGVVQNKIPGEDLWDHTLRTVDAAANQPNVRLAALLHDVGKPDTAADGHFYHHEAVGADLAATFLERLRVSGATRTRVVHLVRQHMFRYEPAWGDPAVRRFLARIGPDAIDDLLALREADNEGSGLARNSDDLDEFRERLASELRRGAILDRSALAIDGSDLMAEVGVPSGPDVGRILAILFDRVVDNPTLNERAILLETARSLVRRPDASGSHNKEAPMERDGSTHGNQPPARGNRAGELSVQLYAVREALAADADATLGRIAALGFRTVEPYDLVAFRDRLRDGLARHGLAAPTAHVGLLGNVDLDAAFDAAAELGVDILIQPWTEPDRWSSRAGVERVAADLNHVATRAAARGLRVGYHNHHFELASQVDGRTALEVFADALDPGIALEVDTYWAHVGGADVAELLGRLGERVVALHVKDGDGSLDTSRQVAVGSGTLPIAAILAAAPAARRVIELDDTAGDRFVAIEASRTFVLGLADEGDRR